MDEIKTTPMMVQWHECKQSAKGALLLFRMGDFYEAFYEDAAILSKELDLTLTKRQEIPMSGVPWHASETYIDRLIEKGYRVAIAEQTEDPKLAKGIVRREVVKIVTPGAIIHSSLLHEKSNNYFVAIAQVGAIFGICSVDLSTGECFVLECGSEKEVVNEVYRLKPAEILLSEKFAQKHEHLVSEMRQGHRFLLTAQEDWHFGHQFSTNFLVTHFNIRSLDGFGVQGMVAAINAAGALLSYLKDTLCHSITSITEMQICKMANYMAIDMMTQRNLELTESLHDGSKKNTLLDILDQTQTSMGGRLLCKWVKQPLLSVEEIRARQEAVGALLAETKSLHRIVDLLQSVRDLERLMMKISSVYASPRDFTTLAASFLPIPELKSILASFPDRLLSSLAERLDALPQMTHLIRSALVDEPPARLSDGHVFRQGYHLELDELKELSYDNKAWIARYQSELREQLNIKTLKVNYNKMFGYYIEVSRGQTEKMPDTFLRRQTLVNAERYLSPELKEYETKILSAEEKIAAIEAKLFAELREKIIPFATQVFHVAQSLAHVDCLVSLAIVAQRRRYAKPTMFSDDRLMIIDGRHPVIEANRYEERFIPNDTILDSNQNRLFLITGPNMAGKSTYIRQVALIVIMAQIGSYVPAKEAEIGVVDKVFTRIGASDNLTRGQSTFMVEMAETANILHNATNRSLIILDEIGRGTSTYDGISIAWAVAEYLLTAEGKLAKTLFATHYWELTKLEELLPGAVNYHVAVQEDKDNILFLRKIIKGSTDKSYGIHVARLAGMPLWVISRAKEILGHLEENGDRKHPFSPAKSTNVPRSKGKLKPDSHQMSFL